MIVTLLWQCHGNLEKRMVEDKEQEGFGLPEVNEGIVSPLRSRGEGSRRETGGFSPKRKHPPASLRSASPLFHRGDKATREP